MPDRGLPAPHLAPGVQWSVLVTGGSHDDVLFEHSPHLVLRTASIGKTLLLVEVARRVALGELDLAEPLTRTHADAVADSGLWQHLASDTLPLADVAALIGAVSDNLATNVLLGRVDLAAAARVAGELGMSHTRLLDRVRDVRTPDDPPALSVGSAAELTRLFEDLSRGRVFSSEVSAQVLDWLAPNTDLSMVAAAFGLDPLAHVEPDRGIVLRNKTGTNATVRADVGVACGPLGRVAYAVIANADMAALDGPRDAVLASMRSIGELVRASVTGASGARRDRPPSDDGI